MTKLQVALDGTLESALSILERVHPFIDIVEVGTPLIFREGMHGVRKIRELYPDLDILADLKIMDAGEDETQIALEAGANLVTVMGVTNDETIQGTIKAVNAMGGQVMVDMMQVSDLVTRGRELFNMGCDILCVHTAYDVQSRQSSPYNALKLLRDKFPHAKLAIAGGVTVSQLDNILPYQPDVIVVGSAITRAKHPAQIAQAIANRIH